MSDVLTYRLQFCLDGQDITHDMYAEVDADEVRAWDGAHGEVCILAATRAGAEWDFAGSDLCWEFPENSDSFAAFSDLLAEVAESEGIEIREAECRCGTPDVECD